MVRFSESALSTAVDFLGLAGELVLTRVVDRQEESPTSEAREYLEGVAQRLRETYPGIHVSTEVRHGEPAGSLALAAIERGADLVVMATHGRTGVRRSIMGSVAGGVLRIGGTPLLLVGPANAPVSQKPATTPRA
jgi:nucleotide-binding universal stress UspA family protein